MHILLLLAQEVRGDSVQAVAGQLVVALQGSEPSLCEHDIAGDGAVQQSLLGAGPAWAPSHDIDALSALLCPAKPTALPVNSAEIHWRSRLEFACRQR